MQWKSIESIQKIDNAWQLKWVDIIAHGFEKKLKVIPTTPPPKKTKNKKTTTIKQPPAVLSNTGNGGQDRQGFQNKSNHMFEKLRIHIIDWQSIDLTRDLETWNVFLYRG